MTRDTDRIDAGKIDTGQNEADLAPFFEAARAEAPGPSGALMARVLADGLSVQPQREVAAVTARPSWWAQLSEAWGGRAGLGGMVAATMAGIWLGYASPDMVQSLTPASDSFVMIDTEAAYELGFAQEDL